MELRVGDIIRPREVFTVPFSTKRLKRKRTITVTETATLLSLRFGSKEMRRDWCAECAADVTWIELPLVIELINFSRFAENCVVHLSDGRVCSRSLTTYLNNPNKEKVK